jgi:hypothetical protein
MSWHSLTLATLKNDCARRKLSIPLLFNNFEDIASRHTFSIVLLTSKVRGSSDELDVLGESFAWLDRHALLGLFRVQFESKRRPPADAVALELSHVFLATHGLAIAPFDREGLSEFAANFVT